MYGFNVASAKNWCNMQTINLNVTFPFEKRCWYRERASLALTYYFPDVDVDLEPSNSFPHSSTSWGDQGSANETWHVRLQTWGLEITKNQVTPKAFLSINNLNLCNPLRSIFVWKCPIPVKAKRSYQRNGGLCSTLQFSKKLIGLC